MEWNGWDGWCMNGMGWDVMDVWDGVGCVVGQGGVNCNSRSVQSDLHHSHPPFPSHTAVKRLREGSEGKKCCIVDIFQPPLRGGVQEPENLLLRPFSRIEIKCF